LGSFIDIVYSQLNVSNQFLCADSDKELQMNNILPISLARFQSHLHQFLPTFPRYAARQASQSRRGNPNFALDVYEIFPGSALRCAIDRDVIFHLRCHRNAGTVCLRYPIITGFAKFL
jgi:hypothetical protein